MKWWDKLDTWKQSKRKIHGDWDRQQRIFRQGIFQFKSFQYLDGIFMLVLCQYRRRKRRSAERMKSSIEKAQQFLNCSSQGSNSFSLLSDPYSLLEKMLPASGTCKSRYWQNTKKYNSWFRLWEGSMPPVWIGDLVWLLSMLLLNYRGWYTITSYLHCLLLILDLTSYPCTCLILNAAFTQK